MPTMTRHTIIPGLATPFFPMRPTSGPSLLAVRQIPEIFAMSDRYVLNRKLNGDRVQLSKIDGKLYLANRHGEWYTYSVNNSKRWLEALPDGSCLDGEVWQKNFYPFETLSYGGISYLMKGPEDRCEHAASLTKEVLGQAYMFGDVSESWMIEWLTKPSRPLSSVWEGVVMKRRGSPYIVLPNDSKNSSQWFKRRWLTN
jgi:ATP-dependent DNA ligase